MFWVRLVVFELLLNKIYYYDDFLVELLLNDGFKLYVFECVLGLLVER